MNTNSLTKTNSWSGRNEVTETSGRLHPLWPQNKWLHTPRTTDYRHTRQDRWIQTELAFTLAKNTTKPNPLEIIPLQTTRKENSWKTVEALARAAATVETERIIGSNHWCLWWDIYIYIYIVHLLDKCSKILQDSRYIQGANKSLARPGRKEANVSVRMVWISFGALPCKGEKTCWKLASRFCWNRARPWQASKLIIFINCSWVVTRWQ